MGGAPDLPAALAEVVSQFGRRIVDRPAQLRAALVDTLGRDAGDVQAEIEAAVAASATGVASALRDSDPGEPPTAEQIRAWFDQLVATGLSLRDAALATSSWATAFQNPEAARRSSEVAADLDTLQEHPAPSSMPPLPTGREATPPAGPEVTSSAGPGAEWSAGPGPADADAARGAPATRESTLPDPARAPSAEAAASQPSEDERTQLGSSDLDDLTETATAGRPAAPVPVRAEAGPPVASRAEAAATAGSGGPPAEQAGLPGVPVAWPPPIGHPVLPEGPPVLTADAPSAVAHRRGAGRRLPVWAPVVAGAAALVLIAAIAVPILIGALGSSASRPFQRGDLDQFLLTADEFHDAMPGARIEDARPAQDDGRYTASDGTPWEIPDAQACEAVLMRIPPGRDETSSPARTSSATVEDDFLLSSARWYETEEEASLALEDIYPPASSCARVQLLIEGDEFDAALDIRSKEDRSFADVLTIDRVRLARACYRNVNVVACYYADKAAIASQVGDEDEDFWSHAARRVADAEPSPADDRP